MKKNNTKLYLFLLLILMVNFSISGNHSHAQNKQQNISTSILSFNNDLSQYPADMSKFFPTGKIMIKKFMDKTGFEITDSEPNSPGIRIVYPTLDFLNVSSPNLRISGSTTAGAEIFINDIRQNVFPTGAFTTIIKLNLGKNDIKITATKDGKRSSTTLSINYKPSLKLPALPKTPLSIDSEFTNKKDNIYLTYPEKAEFVMHASPYAEAWFQIGDDNKKFIMKEKDIGEENNPWGIRGIYTGSFAPSPDDNFSTKVITFYLSAPNTPNAQQVLLKSDITLSVNPISKPLYMEISSKEGFARLSSKSDRGTFYRLPDGIQFVAAKIINNSIKVKTDTQKEYWLSKNDARILQTTQNITVDFKSAVNVTESNDGIRINFAANKKIPFYTAIDSEKPIISLNWFGDKTNFSESILGEFNTGPVQNSSNNPSQQSNMSGNMKKTPINMRIIPESIKSDYHTPQIKIGWNNNFNWGFESGYTDSGFVIKLKNSPPLKQPNLLAGLRILIDPGHGGESAGAVGCIGFEEKEANLKISSALLDMMKTAGAEVAMTRINDEDVSLEKRYKIALDFSPHILLSIHNNSIGAGSKAEEIAGATVFYFNPNSKLLAQNINNRIKELPIKNRGSSLESFFMTRPHEMLCILVECVFISNPLEERMLISEAFQKDMAKKIYEGIKDFVSAVASMEKQ